MLSDKLLKLLEKIDLRNSQFLLTPPPNLTGTLHTGHILNMSIQDFVVRYSFIFDTKKKIPIMGYDHAGLYAEIIAKRDLPNDCSDEQILNKIAENNEFFKKEINSQITKFEFITLFDKTLYTYSDEAKVIVQSALIKAKELKYLNKASRIMQYDSKNSTYLSDLEIEYRNVKQALYWVKYKLEESDECLLVATTMPETIEADICLVVNPDDERYSKYINKEVVNPISKKIMKINTSKQVIIEFGSGILKITPTLDKKDYEIANELKIDKEEFINIVDDKGILINSIFSGNAFYKSKELFVQHLLDNNQIEKIEKIESSVPFSPRSNMRTVSVRTSQYFIDLPKIEHDAKYKFSEINSYGCPGVKEVNLFLNSLKHWCISRQNKYGHILNEENKLDTWFSSALWIEIFKKRFDIDKKTDVEVTIITGYDIMFFWIYKIHALGQVMSPNLPVKNIIIHGLVCDKDGQKMSKSKNNVIDINFSTKIEFLRYRFGLMLHNIYDKRIKIDGTKLQLARKIIVKLENIKKFIKINGLCDEKKPHELFSKDIATSIMMYRMKQLITKDAEDSLKNIYDFANFVRGEFSNIYIESFKKLITEDESYKEIFKKEILSVFGLVLKYAYCLIPSVAEELYSDLFSDEITDFCKIKNTHCTMYSEEELREASRILSIQNKNTNLKNSITIECNDKICKYLFKSIKEENVKVTRYKNIKIKQID